MYENRVVLVGAEDEENLSIRYLAACLEREGHAVLIVPCSRKEHFRQVLKAVSRFDHHQLVCISIAFQALANLYFELVSQLRAQGYTGHISLGGHFPTFEFRKILETQPGIDSVVRFEGEPAIIRLANCSAGRSDMSLVPNLVYRHKKGDIRENECVREFPKLDELPFPLRSESPRVRLGEKFATLVASRGCWHSSCAYCCIGAFHSKKLRGQRFALRSPGNVAAEIGQLYASGVRLFQFHDDNFMLPSRNETRARLVALKEAIRTNGVDVNDIAFLIKARPDTIDDAVAGTLKELGVIGVFLGIENATQSGLKELMRGQSLESIYPALESLKRYDIMATFNILMFHPKATLEEIDANTEFMRKYSGFPFDFGRAEIVAGSPLEKFVVDNRLIRGSWPNRDYRLIDERVDSLFRLNARTFRDKFSPYAGLINFSIGLGYHACVLKRLHAGSVADELASEAKELIKRLNAFIVSKIVEMRGLESSPSQSEMDDFRKSLFVGCNGFTRLASELDGRMLRLQMAEAVFHKFGIKPLVQQVQPFRTLFSFRPKKMKVF